MRASTLGVVLLVAIAIGMACGGQQRVDTERLQTKIDVLYSEIRMMRREAGFDLEPHPNEIMIEMKRGASVQQAKAVCPTHPTINEACQDVCMLAEHICDNAEGICEIANDLGPSDKWAQEKCASAKASCVKAKKNCCNKCTQAKSTPVW